MSFLTGKNIAVIGGSRGVGRRVAADAVRHGAARVLTVARQASPLR